jgi:hypothetical protein
MAKQDDDRTRKATDGVAVVGVEDGSVFIFAAAKLDEIAAAARDAGQDRVAVFVRRGPGVDDPAINN